MPDLVSVIIPCYNSEKYLKTTLECVLRQDYKHLEIIVVDDGSNDSTRTILESYPAVQVLTHPGNKNQGQSASLNLGVRNAKGTFIAFLDDDDLWHPQKIKRQVEVLQAQPEIGLVHTNGDVIDEAGRFLYSLMPDDFTEENIPEKILLDCYIRTPSAVLVRKKLFDQFGYFDPDRYSMDHDMWIRLSETSRFHYLPDKLTSYRKHQGQKSSKRIMWEDGFDILKIATARHDYGFNLRRKRLAVLYYRLGEFDLKNRSYVRALYNFFSSFALDPIRAIKTIPCASKILRIGNHN